MDVPFKFICDGCGATLLEVEDIAPYQKAFASKPKPTIEALIEDRIGGRCPNCGRILAKRPIKIEIEIVRRLYGGAGK